MLGLHSGHGRIRGNDGSYNPLLKADVTVAKALQQQGYTTALFGESFSPSLSSLSPYLALSLSLSPPSTPSFCERCSRITN